MVARKGDGAGGRNVKYYVRYAGRDARRDDEWVTRDHVRGLVAESALLSDEATTTTGGRRETSSSGRARSAVTVAGEVAATGAADGVAARATPTRTTSAEG